MKNYNKSNSIIYFGKNWNIFQNKIKKLPNDNNYMWSSADNIQIDCIQKFEKKRLKVIAFLIGLVFFITFMFFMNFFAADGIMSKRHGYIFKFSDSWLSFQDKVMPELAIIFVVVFILIGIIIELRIHKKANDLINQVSNGNYLCAYMDDSHSLFYVRIINNGKIVGYKVYPL